MGSDFGLQHDIGGLLPLLLRVQFLRSGEICVPSLNGYDAGAHLSHGDIAVDSQNNPALLAVTIKASKTDPFRKGMQIFIGRTGCECCPLAAILPFLALRGTATGPLFRFANGDPLTRDAFVREVRRALSSAGVDAGAYCGHSFRIVRRPWQQQSGD